jgi:hypothetical protein
MNTDLARIAFTQNNKICYFTEDGDLKSVNDNVGIMSYVIQNNVQVSVFNC